MCEETVKELTAYDVIYAYVQEHLKELAWGKPISCDVQLRSLPAYEQAVLAHKYPSVAVEATYAALVRTTREWVLVWLVMFEGARIAHLTHYSLD